MADEINPENITVSTDILENPTFTGTNITVGIGANATGSINNPSISGENVSVYGQGEITDIIAGTLKVDKIQTKDKTIAYERIEADEIEAQNMSVLNNLNVEDTVTALAVDVPYGTVNGDNGNFNNLSANVLNLSQINNLLTATTKINSESVNLLTHLIMPGEMSCMGLIARLVVCGYFPENPTSSSISEVTLKNYIKIKPISVDFAYIQTKPKCIFINKAKYDSGQSGILTLSGIDEEGNPITQDYTLHYSTSTVEFYNPTFWVMSPVVI